MIKVGDTGYVYMMTSDGVLLAYPPDPKQIMKLNISDEKFGKAILEMKNGFHTYEYEGVGKLAAFRQVEQTGRIVAVASTEAEAFAEAVKIRNILMIVGAIVTVILCLAIIFLVSLFVLRPIQKMVAGLKDIAQGEGDLTKPLDIRTRDELGELAGWSTPSWEISRGL